MRRTPFLIPILFLLPLFGARKIEKTAAEARPGGKDIAIFFAVEAYENPSSWKKLPGLIRECEAVAGDLRDLFGFESKVISNPSLAEIDAELSRLRGLKWNEDDQLLVFFSGHGQFMDDVQTGFFIPKEGKSIGFEARKRDWYSLRELRWNVTTIPCRHILLAIDACFSGTADDRVALKGDGIDEEWAEPTNAADQQFDQKIHDQLRCPSRILMTSGGKTKTENPSKFAASFRSAFATLGGKDRIVRPSDIEEEWAGLTIPPMRSSFENHEPCGAFLFVYQPKTAKTPEKTPVPTPISGPDPRQRDFDDWLMAKKTGTQAAFEKYLRDHADGEFTGQANEKIQDFKSAESDRRTADQKDQNDRRDDLAWAIAEEKNTAEGFEKYLADWPNGRHVTAAKDRRINDGLLAIPAGKFTMGDTRGEGESDEKPTREVTLSAFFMGATEVTFEDFDRFCDATGRSKPADAGWGRGRRPVINVDWYDAIEFCNWLSSKNGLKAAYAIDKNAKDASNLNTSDSKKWTVSRVASANGYCLPTEAEWEYAAAIFNGKKARFGNGKDIIDPAEINFDARKDFKKDYSIVGQYREKTVAVASLNSPNGLGLHDMSGNVWEWCWDWNDAYPSNSQTNPTGPSSGTYRVLRGGSWVDFPINCRAVNRFNFFQPNSTDRFVGFRLARH